MVKIGIIMVSMREPTERYAEESINWQTRKPDTTIIVRDFSPISAACNFGYRYIGCDWVAEIGSDFIIKPDTLEILEKEVKEGDGCVYGKLWDTWRQIEIASMMIYNFKAMEEIGFYRDVPDTDTDVQRRLNEAGYKTRQINHIFGLHNHQFTSKRYAGRCWNAGKRFKSIKDFLHDSKCHMISFKRTRRLIFLMAMPLETLGFFFGRREDVRA
jgi:hypothetical protein